MEILMRFCSVKRKKPGNLFQKHVQSLQVSGSSSNRRKDCLEASRTPALGRCLQPPCEKAALRVCAAPRPQLPPAARASPQGSPLQGPRAPWLAQAISRHISGSQANPLFGFPGQLIFAETQLPALPDAPGVLGKPKESQGISFSLILSKGWFGLTCPHLQDHHCKEDVLPSTSALECLSCKKGHWDRALAASGRALTLATTQGLVR